MVACGGDSEMNYQQRYIQRQYLEKRLGERRVAPLDIPVEDLKEMVKEYKEKRDAIKEG